MFIDASRHPEIRLRIALCVWVSSSLWLSVLIFGRVGGVRIAAVVRSIGLIVGASTVSVRVSVGSFLPVLLLVAPLRLAVALAAVMLVIIFAGLISLVIIDEKFELVVPPFPLNTAVLVMMSHL